MMFHLARFSLFLLVIMIGFSISFFSLFSECDGDVGDNFQDFGKSMLTLFHAMLGGGTFEVFEEDYSQCNGGTWMLDAGIFLLVLYLIVMAILLLNLLIAVLSTIHDEVSGCCLSWESGGRPRSC